MHASPKPMSEVTRAGTFHYLADSVEPSLFRNGKVLTRRDRNGSDGGRDGVVLEPVEMLVTDARQLPAAEVCTLAQHGFELQVAPLAEVEFDFFDHNDVVRNYYPACVDIVRRASGAEQVFAFDHNVRSAAGKSAQKRIAGGQQVQGPAHVVHGDYTLTSAPQRLRDLARPPSENDTLRSVLGSDRSLLDAQVVAQLEHSGGRFAIINVWRNIVAEPVQTHPLALCDASSVKPEDLVVFEIHYHDRVGENYFAKHASQHRWYFYPQMTRDETLLIKQWDSAGAFAASNGQHEDGLSGEAPCTFSFHSAFADPHTVDDAPERWSIEVRCIALYT